MTPPTHTPLDGVRMHVTSTDPTGVVNAETIFHFKQSGADVEAAYAGGPIRTGLLLGRLTGDTLDFRYVQAQHDGTIDGGQSTAKLDHTKDGRLRLTEHFAWESRESSGVNVFEQLKD